jgi:general stress protein 26
VAENSGDVKKLAELIKDIKVAMLTTVAPDGKIHSRPMMTQDTEFDGVLWFFTGVSTSKVHEIETDQHVNVTYANPEKQHYVSVSGRAQILSDRRKAEELWNPMYKAWFPGGLDDPDLRLLRVEIESAEYWDSPSSAVAHIAGLAKALLTGKRADSVGEHETVKL